jgi:hypothetical protein
MNPKRALAERNIHDTDDLSRDFRRISVGGLQTGKALQRLIGNAGIGDRLRTRRPASDRTACPSERNG